MQASKKDTEVGRYLSLVLRHNPAAAGITLDGQGWADVEQLLAGCRRAGKDIDRETLERIVRDNSKQRFAFNDDHTRIRANQGHSLQVDLGLKACVPPNTLYHGTASRFLESIREEGIKRGTRQHVHLSEDLRTAMKVGSRHGQPLILPVDAAAMHRDGHSFYLSDNEVWLCEYVPWKYVLHEGVHS